VLQARAQPAGFSYRQAIPGDQPPSDLTAGGCVPEFALSAVKDDSLMENSKFLELLDELFELDVGTITEDSVLKETPGWSSLTFVGLIAMIDEECGVALPPNAILSSRTAGELLVRINAALSGRSAA